MNLRPRRRTRTLERALPTRPGRRTIPGRPFSPPHSGTAVTRPDVLVVAQKQDQERVPHADARLARRPRVVAPTQLGGVDRRGFGPPDAPVDRVEYGAGVHWAFVQGGIAAGFRAEAFEAMLVLLALLRGVCEHIPHTKQPSTPDHAASATPMAGRL